MLRRLDVGRLLALQPHLLVKRHLLPFLEGFKPLRADFREMGEQIFTASVGRDEAETLVVFEPLDRTGCHFQFDPES